MKFCGNLKNEGEEFDILFGYKNIINVDKVVAKIRQYKEKLAARNEQDAAI